MRDNLLSSFIIVMICGCQFSSMAVTAMEEVPVPNAVEHPIQAFSFVDIKQFNKWGIMLEPHDMEDGEFGLYVHVREPALTEVMSGKLEVNFSVWTDKKQMIVSIPKVHLNKRPFLLRKDYLLRMVVNTSDKSLGMTPGVGYVIDIDPADHL